MKKFLLFFSALVCSVAMSMADETVYFVNAYGWTDVHCYAWTPTENATWPGVAMTKENYQLMGADVYSYTAADGAYANCIFNGGAQTGNLKWTAGKYYYKEGWYTRQELESGVLPEQQKDTVFFVNKDNWNKVYFYAWNGLSVGDWPGTEMTKADYQLKGADVYYFTAPQGSSSECKFTNNEGTETSNTNWNVGKYWYDTKWCTRAELESGTPIDPEPKDPVIALVGTMNDWNTTANPFILSEDKATATASIDLAAGETYGFKIWVDAKWLTNENSGTMTSDNCTAWLFNVEDGMDNETHLTTTKEGSYKFIWTVADQTLSVTYPIESAVENAIIEAVPTKVVRDGQVLIVREGVAYTLMGQVAE